MDNNSLLAAVALRQGTYTGEAAVDWASILAREEQPTAVGVAVDDVCPVEVALVEVVAVYFGLEVASIGRLAGAGDGVKVVCWHRGMAEVE